MNIKNKVLSVILCFTMVLGTVAVGGDEFAESLGLLSVGASADTNVCLSDLECTDEGHYTGNEGDARLYKLDATEFSGISPKGFRDQTTRNGNVGIDGTVYNYGLEVWIARWNYTSETSWAYRTFKLNGKYKILSGKSGLINSYNTDYFNDTVYFYDGETLLYSFILTANDYEKSFSVNVAGVDELKILVKDNESVSGGTSFALYNLFLDYVQIPANVTQFNGRFYKVFDEGKTWPEAKAYCESLGGHLVTITSQDEQSFVESILSSGTRNAYFAGAERTENSWTWVTNEPWGYSNWAKNQPDNDMRSGGENVLMIYRNQDELWHDFGKWNDLNEGGIYGNSAFFGIDNMGFICEWENTSKTNPVFNENQYIADIWLNQNGKTNTPESAFFDMLLGFDSVSASMYYELKNDSSFSDSLLVWNGLKAAFNTVEYTGQLMSETEVYTTLIFDLLREVAEDKNDSINNIAKDVVDTTGDVGKTVTKHKGYIDNLVKLTQGSVEGLLNELKTWKVLGKDSESFQEFYGSLNDINDDLSKWDDNNFVKGIGKIADVAEDVSDFYAKFTGYLYAIDMADEMQILLREMRKYASDELLVALNDVLAAVENADYVVAALTMDFGEDVIVDVADAVFEKVSEYFPNYYALKKTYEYAVAFDDLILNTSDIIDNYYLIKASTEFIESNKKAVLSLANKYKQSRSSADAGAYVFAAKAYHHAYVLDTDSAASFIKAADDEGSVNQLKKAKIYIGNLVTGSNEKTGYQQFMESKKSIEKDLKSQFWWLDNSWIVNESYLKADYPDIYPIYLSRELSADVYTTNVDAYIAPSGKTEICWSIPWYFKNEDNEMQALYASSLITGITATEKVGGVSNTKDYNPDALGKIPNPITFYNSSKFKSFPKYYSVVSYADSSGNKTYTTPVNETLVNPLQKVQISAPLNDVSNYSWADNGVSFWIFDSTNSRYNTIVYDIYRKTDNSSWSKIGTASRQNNNGWNFIEKNATVFYDSSATGNHLYSYKVVSHYTFENGLTLDSPESMEFVVSKATGEQALNASIRKLVFGSAGINSNSLQNQPALNNADKNCYYEISWPAMDHAEKYEIYRISSYGNLYKLVAVVSDTTYNDYNIQNGASYNYVIVPVEFNGLTKKYNTDSCAECDTRNASVVNLSVAIKNYRKIRTEAYKATITFTAESAGVPSSAKVHWFVDGKDKGTGEKYTVNTATKDYTIQAKLLDSNGNVLAESETESVKIKSGFIARLIAFFRQLFRRLPVIVQ